MPKPTSWPGVCTTCSAAATNLLEHFPQPFEKMYSSRKAHKIEASCLHNPILCNCHQFSNFIHQFMTSRNAHITASVRRAKVKDKKQKRTLDPQIKKKERLETTEKSKHKKRKAKFGTTKLDHRWQGGEMGVGAATRPALPRQKAIARWPKSYVMGQMLDQLSGWQQDTRLPMCPQQWGKVC